MAEKIQVRIFPDGSIHAETKGIKGEKCTDLIPILEKLLDAEAVKAEYTEEFYETEQIQIQQAQNIKLE
ncbi:DUF2997 domain-containing protein [Paenibacillus lentus]|uniref:DUF2997 domain-containing protein n=1 Tax=Paenibacillus lentus TaxID=1338368 RepID=UPI00364EE56C